jgi:hypothetical protein
VTGGQRCNCQVAIASGYTPSAKSASVPAALLITAWYDNGVHASPGSELGVLPFRLYVVRLQGKQQATLQWLQVPQSRAIGASWYRH